MIEDSYKKLKEIIDSNEDFLVITHIYPDGDAMGCITAFHRFLTSLGKKSAMVCCSDLPYQYKFLPGYADIKGPEDIADLYEKKRVCIILDCADGERSGMDIKSLKESGSYVVNIDHHRDNDKFGDFNIVDGKSAATAELIFEFIDEHFKKAVDKGIALSIYTGVLTDTGRFQYGNTTAKVHFMAGKLLEFGIYPSEVYKNIYESEPFKRFKLISLVLDRVEYVKSLGLIYSHVLEDDFKKLGLPFYAQDGIIDLLRCAEGSRVTALIKQTSGDKYKVSLRTSDVSIDLSTIAAVFGGGGHKAASAFRYSGDLSKLTSELKAAVEKGIKK